MTRHPIKLFLLLVTALAGVGYVLALTQDGNALGPGLLLVQFAPMLSAFIVLFITQGNLRGLGWAPGKLRYLGLACGLPFLIALMTFGLIWIFQLATFEPLTFLAEAKTNLTTTFGWAPASDTATVLLLILLNGTLGLLFAFPAVGEEIGWRGFLAPELMKYTSFGRASVVLGVIWSTYHFPLLIWVVAPHLGVAAWPLMISSVLGGIALTFLMNWMRMVSGSVWTAVIFHLALNTHIQGFFARMTQPTSDVSRYISNEYGFMIAAVSGCLVSVVWIASRSGLAQRFQAG